MDLLTTLYAILSEPISDVTQFRSPGDIAKAALEWNPQGTRPRGRPRTTWRRTILEEIRHQGKTWKEIKVPAKNRI